MILFLCLGMAYLIRSFVFYIGARRAARPERAAGFAPKISVVVAARNEERNIGRCLESLAALDYPHELAEFIVMDDGSTDRTSEIASAFASLHPAFRLVHVQPESSHLRGKSRAVAQGFDCASGEIFVTTDADCVVQPRWLRELASYFTPETGIVAGFTLLEHASVFEAVQSLDWAYLLTIASAGAGLRVPMGCIGNNLAFRRAAYESAGGYRSIPFSITEDFALLKSVWGTKRWKYKYPLDAAMLVWSVPSATLGALWAQRRRWAEGGKKLGALGVAIITVSVVLTLGLFYAAVAGDWSGFAMLLAFRFTGDLMILLPTLRGLECGTMAKYFLLYELYALAAEALTPFGLLKKNIEWKGRTF